MLAGEIPVDEGVIITDGFTLVYSPISFGEARCMSDNYSSIASSLLEILNTARNAERYMVEYPFKLDKVSSKIRDYCREYSTQDKYKKSYVSLGNTNATFLVRHIINVLQVVGSKARGYLACDHNLFNGKPYLVVEPRNYTDGNSVCAILLQSEKAGN